MAFDLQEAKAILPQVQDQAIRARLMAKIRQFEPGFGEQQQEGIAGLVSQLGAPQETEITEIRGKPGAAAVAAPVGEGGSGGGGAAAPTGDGGSGMVGNVPDASPEQQLQQLEIDQQALERAQTNASVKAPPEWTPQRPLTLADRIPRDMGGRLEYYIEPSRNMFRAELAQRARGLEQHAKAAQQALQTQAGAMAPEAMLELQRIVQEYQQTVRDATEAGAVQENSPSFIEWRDQKWAEWLAQHQQNPEAGPAVRTDRAPTNTLWEKIGYGQQKAKEVVFGGGAALTETATAGLATGLLEGALGKEAAGTLRAVRDESPVSDTIGAILGVMTPGSLAGKLATGAANLASKGLGKVAGGAAAGAATAAGEGAVSDLSHDFLGGQGEQRFGNPASGMSEADKLAARLGIGAVGGAVGGALQKRAQRALDEGNVENRLFPSGGIREEAEAAGFKPKLTGSLEVPEEAMATAAEARARGTTAEDVLARAAAPSMADTSARRVAHAGADLAQIKAAYRATKEGREHTVSAAPMVRAFDEEIARMTQSTGQPMVGAQRRAIEAERWKLFDPNPVAVVPAHQAQIATMNTPGAVALDAAAYKASPIGRNGVTVPDGHVVILQPNRLRALELENQIDRLQFTLKPGRSAPPEGQTAEAFRGLDKAAREMRDEFPWPEEWSAAGWAAPTEVIELADGTKVTLKGWSAMIRKAALARSRAEETRSLAGIRSDAPFSRQNKATEVEPFLDKIKSFPNASQAEREAMLNLTAWHPEAEKALRLLASIAEARKLNPGSANPTGVLSTTGPRLVNSVSPGRVSNSIRSLLLQLAEQDPKAPSALYTWITAARAARQPSGQKGAFIASELPPREAFGLAPLRVGQGRLGAEAGAGYNAQQTGEQRTDITPDTLLKELTAEDLQLLEKALAVFSKKGSN